MAKATPSGDTNCLVIQKLSDGRVRIVETDNSVLVVITSEANYRAFWMGVRNGELAYDDLDGVPVNDMELT